MNPIAKELWVNALAGTLAAEVDMGDYPVKFKQIHGPLYKDGGYCAVGVLVYLYCKVNGKYWNDVVDGLDVDEDVFKWAEFAPLTTIITAGERTERVPVLNDHFKILFPVLAEAIRTQL